MNAVIEIHKIRQIVHPHPFDGLSGTETGAHRLERRAGVPDLRMAVHAGLGGRNVGEARFLYSRVTVQAIDSEPADMVLMAELHRLHPRLIDAGGIAGAAQLRKGPRQKTNNEDRAEYRNSGERIGTAVKDLGHKPS